MKYTSFLLTILTLASAQDTINPDADKLLEKIVNEEEEEENILPKDHKYRWQLNEL